MYLVSLTALWLQTSDMNEEHVLGCSSLVWSITLAVKIWFIEVPSGDVWSKKLTRHEHITVWNQRLLWFQMMARKKQDHRMKWRDWECLTIWDLEHIIKPKDTMWDEKFYGNADNECQARYLLDSKTDPLRIIRSMAPTRLTYVNYSPLQGCNSGSISSYGSLGTFPSDILCAAGSINERVLSDKANSTVLDGWTE